MNEEVNGMLWCEMEVERARRKIVHPGSGPSGIGVDATGCLPVPYPFSLQRDGCLGLVDFTGGAG